MEVHRCRFVPYPPSAINALAFSHSSSLTISSKGLSTLRLAIGRANGDLEIWNPLRGLWHQESIFRGAKDRSIEGLVWTHDPEEKDRNDVNLPGKLRLFSIGYSDAVTEWDLSTGRPIRHASGNYGELWCMAAQPREQPPKKMDGQSVNGISEDATQHQCLAVGCADGSIVLLSTSDGDLTFQKTLTRPAKKKARVLSIAWQNKNTVVTGHADSTIRVFDIRNGHQIRSMSLGTGPEGAPKDTLVWSVKTMGDGTIVTGDSTGTISFWDAMNYSRLQRITSHKADILDLAVSIDDNSVFSGSMDRRTTLYRKCAGSRPGEKTRWGEVAHQRFHSHDVKAMAIFETQRMSILVSGGLDTAPIIVPVREFGREHHRTLSSLPQQPPVCSAPTRRLLVSWWDREVTVWRVLRAATNLAVSDDVEDIMPPQSKRMVAKVLLQVSTPLTDQSTVFCSHQIQGDESITSADISREGSLLAVSTLSEIKVFRLRDKVDSTISLRKVDLPSDIGHIGANIVQWSPDCRWLLLVTSDSQVQVVRVAQHEESRHLPRFLPKTINLKRLPRKMVPSNHLHGSLGAYDRSVCRVAFSADSRILVVGDLSGYLDTWVLEGQQDFTQNPPITSPNDNDTSSTSSTDESESEDQPTLVYAQQWKHSATAHLTPKLPSGPLIMSFRPAVPSPSVPATLTNGNTQLHPPRHNPYPHSQELTSGEHRLFVLTSEHRMYEFDILAGKLSDWSRRNPKSVLPKEFRSIRDRAMGSIWHLAPHSPTTIGRQRIWLYGATWLWMFDLGQDLPQSAPEEESDSDLAHSKGPSQRRKRKREKVNQKKEVENATNQDGENSSPPKPQRERDTGAGSKVPIHELSTGVGRKMRKIDGPEGGDAKFIHLNREVSPERGEEEDEEEGEAEVDRALVNLRRGEDVAMVNGNVTEATPVPRQRPQSPPYWGTFKYRPILGIVPIGGEEDDDEYALAEEHGEGQGERRRKEKEKGVEVALVERPMFEVDLPGRFYGDQEWSERKDADVRV
ncbi:MAG: hypothetical protein Q9182_004332 [Xanthomendoza sp. 2 TL-2023]